MSTDKMCMRKHFLHRRHCTNESLRKMKYKKVRVRVNTANLSVLRPDVVSSLYAEQCDGLFTQN